MKKYLIMIWKCFLYVGTYILLQLVLMGVTTIVYAFYYAGRSSSEEVLSKINSSIFIITLVAAFVSLGIYILMLRKKEENFWTRCKFKRITSRDMVNVIIATMALSFISSGFIYLTQNIFKDYEQISQTMVGGLNSVFGIIIIIILIPIFEELLFRGMIFNELRKNLNVPAAIILQALIFGIAHGNIAQGTYAFLMGIVAGFIYVCTKSIWSNIILHISFNLFGTFGTIILDSFLERNAYGYIILGFILLTAILIKIYRNRTVDDSLIV
jgi:uncharacterized protein